MDYITILATRQILLFVPTPQPDTELTPTNTNNRHPLPPSPPSNNPPKPAPTFSSHLIQALPPLSIPSPSSTPHPKLSPGPISMPLQSLMIADTDCAHFLIHQHILPSYKGTTRGIAIDKKIGEEAEVLAWREICKAKNFARGLGEWFGRLSVVKSGGGIGEDELGEIGRRFGVGVVPLLKGGGKEAGEKEMEGSIKGLKLGTDEDEDEEGEEHQTWREEVDGKFEEYEEVEIHSPASSGGATLSDTDLVIP